MLRFAGIAFPVRLLMVWPKSIPTWQRGRAGKKEGQKMCVCVSSQLVSFQSRQNSSCQMAEQLSQMKDVCTQFHPVWLKAWILKYLTPVFNSSALLNILPYSNLHLLSKSCSSCSLFFLLSFSLLICHRKPLFPDVPIKKWNPDVEVYQKMWQKGFNGAFELFNKRLYVSGTYTYILDIFLIVGICF